MYTCSYTPRVEEPGYSLAAAAFPTGTSCMSILEAGSQSKPPPRLNSGGARADGNGRMKLELTTPALYCVSLLLIYLHRRLAFVCW
jgi:hypothetical protein